MKKLIIILLLVLGVQSVEAQMSEIDQVRMSRDAAVSSLKRVEKQNTILRNKLHKVSHKHCNSPDVVIPSEATIKDIQLRLRALEYLAQKDITAKEEKKNSLTGLLVGILAVIGIIALLLIIVHLLID